MFQAHAQDGVLQIRNLHYGFIEGCPFLIGCAMICRELHTTADKFRSLSSIVRAPAQAPGILQSRYSSTASRTVSVLHIEQKINNLTLRGRETGHGNVWHILQHDLDSVFKAVNFRSSPCSYLLRCFPS